MSTATDRSREQDAPPRRSTMATTLMMASGTLVSRVLGFVRAALIAFVLGNGSRPVEAFNLANTIPNSLYILLAGGVMNAVLVPQIVRAMDNDEDGGEAYTNRIMTAFLAALAVLTVIVTIATPWIMRLYTSGGWREPAMEPYWGNMLMIAYLCMPQIFFYGAYVLISQVLNSRQNYIPVMWAPIANNVVAISVFAVYLGVWGTNGGDPFSRQQELLLGIGATLGIAVQFAILVPFLRRTGFVYRPRWDLKGAGLTHTFKLAQWTIYFVIANQLAIFVVNRLASTATLGDAGSGAGLTAYQNASLIWIVPHSLITLSLGTMMVTTSSKLAAAGDMKGVAQESTHTMRTAMTIIVPCAVAFLALGIPLSQLLFGNGAGADDAIFIGRAITLMALGLVAYSLHYLSIRTFYALEDTRTPFLIQVGIVTSNIVFALVLVLPWHAPGWVAAGLGAAYALAYVVGFLVAMVLLRRRLPEIRFAPVMGHIGRLLVAVLPAGAIAWVIVSFLGARGGQLMLAISLAVGGVVAVGIFLLLARILGISEVGDLVATVLRRGGRGSDGSDGPDDGPDGPGPEDDDPRGHAAFGAEDVPVPVQEPWGSEFGTAQLSDDQAFGEGLPPAWAATRPTPPTTGPETTGPARGIADSEQTIMQPQDPRPADQPVASPLSAGMTLGGRFELVEPLTGPRRRDLWRATDLVLRRSVVCQMFAPDDPRTAKLVAAARLAATATDARFVRILDVVESDDAQLGSYVVREFAPGHSLSALLADGPLSAKESAWLVREIADALSAEHARGLSHERLHPDAVMVTDTGNIKILGWQIDRVLFDTDQHEQHGVAADILDLGRILYACLTGTWPGTAIEGLPTTPTHGGMWPRPSALQPVPAAMDRITEQVLGAATPMLPNTTGRTGITSVEELEAALSKVLGVADASYGLEQRVRRQTYRAARGITGRTDGSDHTRLSPAVPSTSGTSAARSSGGASLSVSPDADRGRRVAGGPRGGADFGAPGATGGARRGRRAVPPPVPIPFDLDPNTPFGAAPFTVPRPAPDRGSWGHGQPLGGRAGTDHEVGDDFDMEHTYVAAEGLGGLSGLGGGDDGRDDGQEPLAVRPRVHPRRRWMIALLVVAAIALVLGLVGVLVNRGDDTDSSPRPTTQASTEPEPTTEPTVAHEVVESSTFDPPADGGNGDENPDNAALAHDGDATTAWRTMAYYGSPDLGGLKDGVGLVLDLGEAQDVSTVSVALLGEGSTVELRVPSDPSTDTAPTGTADEWQVLDTATDASGTVDLATGEPVRTRYVMVYFTSLPPDGGDYRGGIYEVQVGS